MSPELRQFLSDWLAWAEGGAPDANPHDFVTYHGLSGNSENWAAHRGSDIEALWSELETAFAGEEYLIGKKVYGRRRLQGPQHENPNCLAWVRAQLAVAEVPA